MTGAHAAAIGLESIDIMCRVTSTPLALSHVAFVPTGTGCTGTHAATADMFGSTGLVDREGVGMASNALAHSCNPT